ncbi:MAG: hypothetical protein EAZ53_08560 [Bacteroidetes bacterium]|nr:MAG: hypothetical protein EAZ53_08560 [Bacteroidota bacterium]
MVNRQFNIIFFLLFLSFLQGFTQNKFRSTEEINTALEKADFLIKQDELKEASGIYNDIAIKYWEDKNLDLAIEYFTKSYRLNEKLNSEGGKAMISSNLAMIYCDKTQYEKGIEYFNKSLAYRRTTGDKVAVSSGLINLSIAQNNIKKYEESVVNLEEALKLSMEINDTKQMRACYGMLAETYEKMGNVERTMHYFKFYKSFNDLVSRKREKELTQKIEEKDVLLLQSENESQKKELELLRRNQELSALSKEMQMLYENVSKKELVLKLKEEETKAKNREIEIQKQKLEHETEVNNYVTWGGGIIILILLILLIIGYSLYRFRNKTNKLLKQQNAEISHQKANIEYANKTKDKLLSVLGHDLRGPFATFKNLIQLMDMKVLSQDDVVTHIKDMSSLADSTLLMLDNTLIWARGQMNGEMLEQKNIELYIIVKEVLSFLSETAKIKNIELINHTPPELVAFADANQIKIVIRNLVSNAIKFTLPNGKITIAAHSYNDEFVSIRVTDTGIGMKPEDVEKLFTSEHFTKTGTKNEKGTGLGLLLCKDYIETNGGKINVTSEVNKGTTFAFTLKVSDNRTVEPNLSPADS